MNNNDMKLNIIRNSVKGSALFLGVAMLLCGCQKEQLPGLGMMDTATRFEVSVAEISDAFDIPDTKAFMSDIPLSCRVMGGIALGSVENTVATKATLYNTTGDNTHKLSEYLTEFQVAAWEGTSGTGNFIPADTKVKYITTGEDGADSYWSTVDGSGNIKEYKWKKTDATKTFFAWANLPASGASVECTSAASQTLKLTALPDNDILMGFYQGDGSTTGTASIRFYHPLTAVKFKEGTLSEGVSITNISIKGIYTSGKTTQTSTTGTAFAWTKIDGSAFAATDETGTASLSSVTVDEYGFIGDAIVLIPQTFASDEASIEVTLDTPTGERTAYYMLKGEIWAAGCTNVITIGYDNSECIRFSAPTEHSISFNFNTLDGQTFNIQYSTDATTWTDYTSETGGAIDFGPSNDVYFRGVNPTGLGSSYTYTDTDDKLKEGHRGCSFQITDGSAADVTVSGDIMSLINYDDISEEIPQNAFIGLFKDCSALKTANNLQLSAESLSPYCYYQMFYGCTGLVNAPELLAENISSFCYAYMFYGCTSLEKAPVIHATTLQTYCFSAMFQGCTSLNDVQSNLYAEELVSGCYDHMFYGCSSLEKAPVIHATKLASNCCQYMFWGCTSLANIQPTLPVETMAPSCYSNMFRGCASLKTAPIINVKTLASQCFQNMFYGCTSLENVQSDLEPEILPQACYSGMFFQCSSLKKAPVIHATTLAKTSCYQMFRDCSNLEYMKCLITTGLDSVNCIDRFLEGVSSTGTFVYNHELGDVDAVRNAYTYEGSEGPACAIPDGWTVIPDNNEE